jgi:flagellar motor switch protein FliN
MADDQPPVDPPIDPPADSTGDSIPAADDALAAASADAAGASPIEPTGPDAVAAVDAVQAALDAAAELAAEPPPADAMPDELSAEASALNDQAAIDELLKQASFEDPDAVLSSDAAAGATNIDLPSFQQVMADAQVSSIDLLRDVELNVKIELGRSRMLIEDVLKLNEGSVVELDKLAGDPVDVFVNDRLVARGEVLVLNDNFCVRVNEIVAGLKE